MVSKEKRQLKVHPHLIYDVITMQAGSLSKAVTEGIQNCFDAQATRCDIKIDGEHFEITDNGRGFASRDEVEAFFETFGTPHQKTEYTKFARFRIGRGQIFSFAHTTFISDRFSMAVDIKNKGLDYEFLEHSDVQFSGCKVTAKLYDKLYPSELNATLRDIQTALPYFPIPVFMNGDQINTLPADEKWDIETPDCYIKLKNSGGVKVYNYGVFVRSFMAEDMGLSAVVVSKKLLEVNFARNDILITKCAVWKRIRKELTKHAEKRAKISTSLTDDGRVLLIKQFLAGELPYAEFRKVRVFRDALQANMSLNMIMKAKVPVTVAPLDYNRIADRLRETKQAIPLSPKMLEWFEVKNAKAMIAAISKQAKREYIQSSGRTNIDDDYYLNSYILADLNGIVCLPFEQLAKQFDETITLIDYKMLNKRDRALYLALKSIARKFYFEVVRDINEDIKERAIKIGNYGDAYGWTDGVSYIGIGLKHLKSMTQGPEYAVQMLFTLAHEYAHLSPDMGDNHTHDADFHTRFYAMTDQSGTRFGRSATALSYQVLAQLKRTGQKIPNGVLKTPDLLFSYQQAVGDAEEESESEDLPMAARVKAG